MDKFYGGHNDNECKIVVVGDSRCGKTSLIHRVLHDKFLEVYIPTGFERYTAVYEVGSQRINFTVWDTAGSSAYDSVRPLAYQDAKVFLLCFQIDRQQSLQNAINKWFPEIRLHATNVPIVLCGCQTDSRTVETTDNTMTTMKKTTSEQFTNLVNATHHDNKRPNSESLVSQEMAIEALNIIGASTYVETSSMISSSGSSGGVGVGDGGSTGNMRTARDAFEMAALVALGRLNKNHNLIDTSSNSMLVRDRSFETARTALPLPMPLRSKSRLDIKSEFKDRTKSCVIM